MAYMDDLNVPLTAADPDEENRRKVLAAIAASGKQPLLGAPPATATPNPPGSRAADLSVSATNQPRVPAPRISPLVPPTLNPTTPPFLPSTPGRPARPNVAPQREDFPAQPEVSGWKKYLGLGLAALTGPRAA